ncbi:MAG TPA: cellulase family glycosylhydrolase [Armatimonadota bacterium]|jgi:hypothetical protein
MRPAVHALLPILLLCCSAELPAAPSLRLNAKSVPRYGHLEGAIQGVPEAGNPYDARQVDLWVEVTPPSGRKLRVPAFWWEGQRRAPRGDTLSATGERGWRFRLTPVEQGRYRLQAVLRNGGSSDRSRPEGLKATRGTSPGFVRRCATNSRYLAFDNGRPYFTVGHNVCWASLSEYDDYFRRMAEVGENYTRVWMIHWNTALEWSGAAEGYDGVGRYNQQNAWKLDYLLEQAERKGIYIMLCLDSFNELRIRPEYPAWDGNPYREGLGGPIKQPGEFFTNPEARRLYAQRLRYLVARYGHFRSLLAWEFWNEVDIIESYVSKDVADWHRQMARELRALDPYNHLITTSYANSQGDPAVDGLPEMDLVQTHNYGSRDMAAMALQWNRSKLKDYRKPHIIGEYGTGAAAEGIGSDPEGIHLHNGIWASALSGSLGTAALWWWDNYIRPRGLYYHFKPLGQFAKEVPWTKASLRPVEAKSVSFAGAPPQEPVSASLISTNISWEAAPYNRPVTVTVPNVEDQGPVASQIPGLLHGVRNHPDLHNPITLLLDAPRDLELITRVGGVSGYGGAGLRVTVDGGVKLLKDFPDTNPQGRNATLQTYAGAYTVPLTQGKHTVVVENPGADWMEASFVLTRYALRDKPPLRALGLAEDRGLYFWLQNADNTWYKHSLGEALKEVPASVVVLPASAGRYTVTWWDTYTGARTPGGAVEARDGELSLKVPPLLKDVAVILRRA